MEVGLLPGRSLKLTGGISLDALVGNPNDNGIQVAILSGAEEDGVFVLSSPEVGAQNEPVLEIPRIGVGSALHRITMQNVEKLNKLGPIFS